MISEDCITLAATHLIATLGPESLKKVGGKKWWQWRTRPLSAEWVEMRSDYNRREKEPGGRQKTMMYIHGGAYFFGSVDLHRYQLQRHARKLQGRVFARRFNFFLFIWLKKYSCGCIFFQYLMQEILPFMSQDLVEYSYIYLSPTYAAALYGELTNKLAGLNSTLQTCSTVSIPLW